MVAGTARPERHDPLEVEHVVDMVSAGLSEGGIGRLHINCDLFSLLVLSFKCGVLSSSPNVVVEHM